MASSSLSHRRNEEHDAFSGIEPLATRRKVDESSRLCDVFINHRGPDVKQTLALQLYNSLTEIGIHAFLDSEEKELGHSFPSTIENAIHSASAHIAIFSEGYAESPWCLAELVLMLQSRGKIIPVFYRVEPSVLRYIEKGKYSKAFTKYEQKRRYMDKLKEWKEALQSVSFITGYEISSNFSMRDCQNIVSAVRKEVQRNKSIHVAKYPVGLHRLVEDFERLYLNQLVEDFESQCRTNESAKERAQIIGIFGMGGVGKTTLAKELFNRKRSHYTEACFLFDVREAYATKCYPSLQMTLVRDLFHNDRFNFQSREEGTSYIGDCIRRSKQLSFLIVVDDIDHVQQMDSLLIMDMLKKSVDSLVIVTTRDAGVLINTGITAAYNLKGMDSNDARELFCWHAFGQPHPDKDYENLVNSFLNVCGGLPLSLQVLGSHVHGRDRNYWSLELNKVSKILPRHIHQRLQISFDALDYEEQQIFLDLACFFVDKSKCIAMEVWEASGWSAQHALETLKNKCLVQEIERFGWVRVGEGRCALRMHDHLRDLGRQMADRLSHPHRLWRPRDLQCLESNGFQNILGQTKGRCFHSFIDKSMNCQITYFLGQSYVSADTSLLWLKLQFDQLNKNFNEFQPSFPPWIPCRSLRCLVICNMLCKSLFQSHLKAATQLKELQIYSSALENELNFSGMPSSLEKILIYNCAGLITVSGLSDLKYLIELNISKCHDLETLSVVNLSCLKNLILYNCWSLRTVPGLSNLNSLIELNISKCYYLKELNVILLSRLRKMRIEDCGRLETVSGLSSLRELVELDVSGNCPGLEKLRLADLNFLERIQANKLKRLELDNCRTLKTISGKLNFENLVTIVIRNCPKLEASEYVKNIRSLIDRSGALNRLLLSNCPNLQRVMLKSGPTCLEKIEINKSHMLNCLQLFECKNLKQVSIADCPELKRLPCFAHQTFLEKISIYRCRKLQNITLPTKLVELDVLGCRELETVAKFCDHSECLEPQKLSSVNQLRCLECTKIERSDKLQIIQGFDKLHVVQLLQLSDSPELEELQLSAPQTFLDKITIDECEKFNFIQLFKYQTLKQVTIIGDLELEKLPCLARQTSLEKISIRRCEKLQNISLPRKLVELRIENCRELETVAPFCDHGECLELQELSVVARPSCLRRITIKKCEKLQTMQGFDEMHALESLQLSDCPELQGMRFSARQTCLGEIEIDKCQKLNCLQLFKCQTLKQLSISDNLELEELPCFARLNCLEKMSIRKYRKLQNITLPTKLVELRIQECRELKTVAQFCDHGECLELQELSGDALSSSLKRIIIHKCEKLQSIQGFDKLHAMECLVLINCPELGELQFCARQTCFQKIRIARCGKLQNITLPPKLQKLVAYRSDSSDGNGSD